MANLSILLYDEGEEARLGARSSTRFLPRWVRDLGRAIDALLVDLGLTDREPEPVLVPVRVRNR